MNMDLNPVGVDWDVPYSFFADASTDPIKETTYVSFSVYPTSLTKQTTNWDGDFTELINALFLIDDYEKVTSFLKRNNFLRPILLEGYIEIRQLFGDTTQLTLSMEDVDEEKLILFIHPDAKQETDMLQMLNKLDETWWLDAMPLTEFKMNIDLEY